ncbi:MAG: hypothetical protein Q4F66_05035 [Clostridium sp.]|nr:hypothetical protein [Clostridium sp.]
MRIRRKGSALISSVIVLSMMSLVGAMYYRMSRYNIQLESLNYNHGDRYNLSGEENDIIYEFMNRINAKIKEHEEGITIDALRSIVLEPIGKNRMMYNSDKDNFILKYCGKDNSEKYRDIDYKINNNKIILVPLYIFKEKDISSVEGWEDE